MSEREKTTLHEVICQFISYCIHCCTFHTIPNFDVQSSLYSLKVKDLSVCYCAVIGKHNAIKVTRISAVKNSYNQNFQTCSFLRRNAPLFMAVF